MLHDIEHHGPQFRREVDEIVFRHPLAIDGWWLRRKRLRRRRLFSGYIRPRSRALDDRPHRRAVCRQRAPQDDYPMPRRTGSSSFVRRPIERRVFARRRCLRPLAAVLCRSSLPTVLTSSGMPFGGNCRARLLYYRDGRHTGSRTEGSMKRVFRAILTGSLGSWLVAGLTPSIIIVDWPVMP